MPSSLRDAMTAAREDRACNRDQLAARLLFTTYRVGGYLREKVTGSRGVVKLWYRIFYQPLVMVHRTLSVVIGCDIPFSASIGRRLHLVHGFAGMYVATRARIGDDCVFFHHVTLGSNYHTSDDPGAPVIGDGVFIGVGARVIGKVRVGNGARIGAGAVVVDDVPDGATAVGPKATIREGRARPLKDGRPPA